METIKKNKEFIIRYFNAISGKDKTPELIDQFVTDPRLKGHIQFFESAFPRYELFIDELTAEGNRVVVKAHWSGKHEGELNGIPATHKFVEQAAILGYTIENEKIIDHWLLGDTITLMEQLGVMNQPV
jgi:predicted ester cyclase